MRVLKKINLLGLTTFGLLLLVWEVSSRSSADLQAYFPPLSLIVASLFQLLLSGEVLHHLLASLGRFLSGYLLAAAIAVTLGVILGYIKLAYSLLEALIEFLRPMPSVAIIPVAILLLGIGSPMIVAVTIYACAWPILIGLKTLARLRTGNVLDPQARIKITRPEVRKMILRSVLCYPWASAWNKLFSSSKLWPF